MALILEIRQPVFLLLLLNIEKQKVPLLDNGSSLLEQKYFNDTFTFPSFSSFNTVILPTRSPVARYSPLALYSTAVMVSV